MSGTGISTVPSPSVVGAGSSGDGVVVTGTVVTVVTVVSVVSVVVVLVVDSSPDSSPPHAVKSVVRAIPAPSANNEDVVEPREVMQTGLARGECG